MKKVTQQTKVEGIDAFKNAAKSRVAVKRSLPIKILGGSTQIDTTSQK